MASYIDAYTDEGKVNADSNDSELNVWLRDNNLSDSITVFQKEKMTLNELLSMGEDTSFLRQYLIDLEIPKSLSTRITFKINQILKNRHNDAQNEEKTEKIQHSNSHIIIWQEEEEAINKLRQYKNHVSLSLQSLMNKSNKLIEQENKLKSEINAQFNHLRDQITIKQKQVLKDLNDKVQEYQLEIENESQQLLEKDEAVSNAIKSCEGMINENEMNRNQRKKQILSSVNDALQTQTPTDHELIGYTIAVKFDQNSFSSVKIHAFLCIM